MNSLKMLVALYVFAGGWIPWLALGVIAVAVLVMVVRDRYRRKLRLAAPAEAAEIEGLLRDGKITAAEAELLLRKCNALPEVEEVAPVPDLSLRLAAAVSRIYAAMMLLVLLFQVVLAALWFWPLPQDVFGGLRMAAALPPWEKIVYVASLWLLVLTAAIVQYFASRRVLTGSWRARNWLIASWLVLLACLHQVFAARYWAPVAGVFVLWVLCWRSGAARKISSRAATASGWRKWALPVVMLAALVLGIGSGVKFNTVTTSVTGRGQSSSGITARLERLYLLCGTPEPPVRKVAEQIAERFRAAGLEVVVAEAGTVPLDIDADRECVIWIGRGEVGGAAAEDSSDLSAVLSPFPDTTPLWAGDPYYQLLCFNDSFASWLWKGFSWHRFGHERNLKVMVTRDDDAAGVEAAADKMYECLESTYRRFTGPDAFRIPEQPRPVPREPWQAPELRDFRLVLRSRGIGGQLEVYAFTAGDEEADRKAANALLERHGFRFEDAHWKEQTDYRGAGRARLYYWLSEEKPERGYYAPELNMCLGTALLAVEYSEPSDRDCDPEFAARYLEEDPVGFLCAEGLPQLEPAAREEVLVHFRALPAMSRLVRREVLQNTMWCPDEWSEAGKALIEDDFRTMAAEVLGDDLHSLPGEINELRRMANRDPWKHLQGWLQEQLGERYRRFSLAGEPGEDGMIRAELKLPVAEAHNFLFLTELDFGDFGYQPFSLWFGLFPDENKRNVLFWSDGGSSSQGGLNELKFPVTFFGSCAIENAGDKPPWRLYCNRWMESHYEKIQPQPGGVTFEAVVDEAALTFRFVFAPLLPEETAWQQRLNALPKGDPAMLELAAELLTRRERPGFQRHSLNLLQACGDAALRQQAGEVLGEFYCRIALPAEADADGIYRAQLRHPVGNVADTRVICEIDAAAAGAEMVMIRYGIGPETGGKYWRIWGDDTEYGLDLTMDRIAGDWLTITGEYRAYSQGGFRNKHRDSSFFREMTALAMKREVAPAKPPKPGEFQLTVVSDPAANELEFHAAYRPRVK